MSKFIVSYGSPASAGAGKPRIKLVHVELAQANRFIAAVHRHHKPVAGHRFSLGAVIDGKLVGVAICGRPVARQTDHLITIEVLRLATDGPQNACSFLYGASARAAASLGYRVIQTFILNNEPGTSLNASGWINQGLSKGGDWNRPSRLGRRMDQPMESKIKFVRTL